MSSNLIGIAEEKSVFSSSAEIVDRKNGTVVILSKRQFVLKKVVFLFVGSSLFSVFKQIKNNICQLVCIFVVIADNQNNCLTVRCLLFTYLEN